MAPGRNRPEKLRNRRLFSSKSQRIFLFGNIVLMIDFPTGETRADGRIKFTTDLTEVKKKNVKIIFFNFPSVGTS